MSAPALEKVRDPHIRMSLELQQTFGLRREGVIKFQPVFADRDDYILLRASRTKGGRARVVPVWTATQRQVLDRARRLVGNASVTPSPRNYRHQLRIYERAYRQRWTLQDAWLAPLLCPEPI